VSSLTLEGSQPSTSQSFSSVDLEDSFKESQEMEITSEVAASSTNEVIAITNDEVVDKGMEDAPTVEDLPTADDGQRKAAKEEDEGQKPEDDLLASKDADRGIQNTSNPELIEEIIIGESSSVENSSSASTNWDAEVRREMVMNISKMTTIYSEPVDQVLPVQTIAAVQIEAVINNPTADSLKAKLQSIVSDLGTVALNREEINELEDLFMDAKQQLYGAGRRGRAGS
jgi:hypothetical protein